VVFASIEFIGLANEEIAVQSGILDERSLGGG
jgi:hypothetical protein